jgi:hypothetical protein
VIIISFHLAYNLLSALFPTGKKLSRYRRISRYPHDIFFSWWKVFAGKIQVYGVIVSEWTT